MAAVTKHLGFGITASTGFEHPYPFARRMSTLDHLTKGRVGWNVVTSYLESGAKNLGLASQVDPRRALRHGRRVPRRDVQALGGVLGGRRGRRATRTPASTPIPRRSTRSSTTAAGSRCPGVHLSEPSPQRTPVIFQAGASSRGRRFAGRHAEAIFTSGPTIDTIAPLVAGLRDELEAAGRERSDARVYTMATVVVDEHVARRPGEARRAARLRLRRGRARAALRMDRPGPLRPRPRRAAAGRQRGGDPVRGLGLPRPRPRGPPVDAARHHRLGRRRWPRARLRRLPVGGRRRDGALGATRRTRTASTSPTRSRRGRSRTSSSTSCPSCSGAACTARSTRTARCATASSGRATASPSAIPEPPTGVREYEPMRISAKADYAVRAAMGLSLVEGPVKAEHLAHRHGIPLKFLEKILFDLRHAGLVATRRGPEGGYWLAKDALGDHGRRHPARGRRAARRRPRARAGGRRVRGGLRRAAEGLGRRAHEPALRAGGHLDRRPGRRHAAAGGRGARGPHPTAGRRR